MLDRKFIRQNPDAVRDALTAKNESGDLDAWLALDTEHLDLLRAQYRAAADTCCGKRDPNCFDYDREACKCRACGGNLVYAG